jgi:hypothetical protein
VGDGSLEALQRFVADAVMRESAIGRDAALVADAERLFSPGPRGMSPADRLDVYREQFWLRHVPSLEEDFPTLSWAVGGRSRFRDLAIEYLSVCPPRTWDLQRLGEGLPSHVAKHSPWDSDVLAHDAARLDWAFMEAFDAADAGPLNPSVLSVAPEDAWPHAKIVFHPSVRTLTLGHPLHELRETVKGGSDPERPSPASTPVVVWRDATCCVQVVAIEGRAYALLVALTSGTPLGQACDAVARATPAESVSDLGSRVTSWFQEWTANGWVSAVRFAA